MKTTFVSVEFRVQNSSGYGDEVIVGFPGLLNCTINLLRSSGTISVWWLRFLLNLTRFRTLKVGLFNDADVFLAIIIRGTTAHRHASQNTYSHAPSRRTQWLECMLWNPELITKAPTVYYSCPSSASCGLLAPVAYPSRTDTNAPAACPQDTTTSDHIWLAPHHSLPSYLQSGC